MIINYKTKDNHFRIKNRGVINVFYLFQVKKLRLAKQRDMGLNIILICSAMASLAIGIFIHELLEPVRLFSYLSCGLFFTFSLTHRVYNYELVLFLRENRVVKIKVDTLELEDAILHVSKINKELRKAHDNYSFPVQDKSEDLSLKQKSFN